MGSKEKRPKEKSKTKESSKKDTKPETKTKKDEHKGREEARDAELWQESLQGDPQLHIQNAENEAHGVYVSTIAGLSWNCD